MTKKGEEPSDYLKGYQHAIFEIQKKYNLRNRNVPIIASKTKPNKDVSKVLEAKNDTPKVAEGKEDSPLGKKDTQLPPPTKEAKKIAFFFNLEN